MIFALAVISIGAIAGGYVYGPNTVGVLSLFTLGIGFGFIGLIAAKDLLRTPRCVNGQSRIVPPDPTASLIPPAILGGTVAMVQAGLDLGRLPESLYGDRWPGAILRLLAAVFLVHFILNLKSRRPDRGS